MAPAGPQGEALICKGGGGGEEGSANLGVGTEGARPQEQNGLINPAQRGACAAQPRPGGEEAPPLPGTGRQQQPVSGDTLVGWPSTTFTVPGRHVNHVPGPEITRPVGLRKPISPAGLGCVPASGSGRLRRGARGALEWPTHRPHAGGPSGLLLAGWAVVPAPRPPTCLLSRPPQCPSSPGFTFHLGVDRVQPYPLCVRQHPTSPAAHCLQPLLRSGTSC